MPGLQNEAYFVMAVSAPPPDLGLELLPRSATQSVLPTISLWMGIMVLFAFPGCSWELLGWVGRSLVRVGIFPWWDRCLQCDGAEG